MMATVPHVTSCLGLRKFQAYGFLFDRVYNKAPLLLTSPFSLFIPLRQLLLLSCSLLNDIYVKIFSNTHSGRCVFIQTIIFIFSSMG